MNICAGNGTVIINSPVFLVNRFADAQVKGQWLYDLPFEIEIGSAAHSVHRRNREGIQHIVFVRIDAVVPIPAVKKLRSQAKG